MYCTKELQLDPVPSSPALNLPSFPAAAMLIVGYDFTGPIPYWIVRNSWGSGWGTEGGYVKVEATDDSLGACRMVSEQQPQLDWTQPLQPLWDSIVCCMLPAVPAPPCTPI